jgi:tRNA (guanosine-2'-O-)-methyltransferase
LKSASKIDNQFFTFESSKRMTEKEKHQLLTNHFIQFISEKRLKTMEKVLFHRTRHVTLVLEDIYQSQNASATVRTCECLGVQDIHFIEKESSYSVNKKVLKGSNKWINLYKYKQKDANNTELCFQNLRANGYRILATDPSLDGIPINEVSTEQKLALVMGNELDGTSEYALRNADQKVNIPMFGFTESFNISVSAAICLNILLSNLRSSSTDWRLSESEIQELRLQWLRRMVRRSELVEEKFLRSID